MWTVTRRSTDGRAEVGKWARCALHLAVERSDDRRESAVGHQIQALLRNGSDIEAVDVFGKTPLLRAAEVGNGGAVSELLHNGASLLARTMEGWTALHLAAGNGHVAVVSQLLDAGCSPLTPDSAGENPMHWAARWGQLPVVEFLLSTSVAPLLLSSDNDGRTPVHAAAEYGREEVFEAFLRHGAAANTADRKGRTPMDLAQAYSRREAAFQVAGNPYLSKPASFDGGATQIQEAKVNGNSAISALMSGKTNLLRSGHVTTTPPFGRQPQSLTTAPDVSNMWSQY